MPLPTQKKPIISDIAQQIILLYGREGIGKSSYCANADNALFLATEPGLNWREVYQMPIMNWDEFKEACAEIATGNHDFKTIIIDTADNALSFCTEHVCAEWKIRHPGDLPMGKGWALVSGEFLRVIKKLSMLPYGLILISHMKTEEIKTRTETYNKIIPSLSGKSGDGIVALADILLFMDIEESYAADGSVTMTPVLRTKPNKYYVAKDKSCLLPEVIVLDHRSGPEDYEKLACALDPFRNQ